MNHQDVGCEKSLLFDEVELHERQHTSRHYGRFTLTDAYSAHRIVEVLGVGIAVDEHLLKSLLTGGLDGVLPQLFSVSPADNALFDKQAFELDGIIFFGIQAIKPQYLVLFFDDKYQIRGDGLGLQRQINTGGFEENRVISPVGFGAQRQVTQITRFLRFCSSNHFCLRPVTGPDNLSSIWNIPNRSFAPF